VGSIGTASSYLTIGSPVGSGGHLLIGNNLVHPATSTGGAKDNAIDIGGSSNRFKDLYLSGNVKADGGYEVGGTTVINSSRQGLFPSVYVDSYIYHNGDANTYILMTTDRIRLASGGVEMIDCVEGAIDYVDIVDCVRVTSGGDLECAGNITAYTSTSISDINQKENIQVIENPIDKIKAISGYTFDWKMSGEHSGGVIAQEIEQVMPSIVKEKSIRDGDKMKTVDYQAIIGLLVETVKDLNQRIEALENVNH